MILTGNGFSFAAPENIVSLGGTSLSAETYEIADDGSETLIFTVPENVTEGETSMLLIVAGRPSNALPFTILPVP